MMDAYDVATIRGLEAEAIAEVGEDTLMQRAASGVAAGVARDAVSLRGRVYGTKIMILIGPGNNGGDALFAGARLARRGAAVTGVRCLGRPSGRTGRRSGVLAGAHCGRRSAVGCRRRHRRRSHVVYPGHPHSDLR